MNAAFTKNKQTGKYDVIGPQSQVSSGGTVTVQKRDGSTTRVYITSVSRPFTAKFGALKGVTCVIGTVGRGQRSRPGGGAETKRCWECGRSFTYAEARQYDGDWQDSYCGC